MRPGIRVIAQGMGIGLIALFKRLIIYCGSGLRVVFRSKLESIVFGCHRAMWFRIVQYATGLVVVLEEEQLHHWCLFHR